MQSNKIPKSILMKTLKVRLHIPNDHEEKFHILLSDAMKMLGIKITKFSEELNVSYDDLALWMAGVSTPNLIEQNHIRYYLLGHYLTDEQIKKKERFEKITRVGKDVLIYLLPLTIVIGCLELIIYYIPPVPLNIGIVAIAMLAIFTYFDLKRKHQK